MLKQPKMITCKTCNASIAKNAKRCPACGAKNKKPFYKRIWFYIAIIIIGCSITTAIQNNLIYMIGEGNNIIDKYTEYSWPTSELTELIPQPSSKYGAIDTESEDSFSITIYQIKQNQFENYIDECKECGFKEDYYRTDESYMAENTDGFDLWLQYNKKEKSMKIDLDAPIEEVSDIQDDENKNKEHADDDGTESQKSEKKDSSPKKDDLVDGMRPEFKEAMDSYEDFYNDYCDFMKKYEKNPTDLELITDYTEMTKKVIDMNEKFDKWKDEDLNNAELKYYLDVQGRVTKKLAEVSIQ